MKVILYKTNIEKNHVIESIEDYLETCDNVIPNVSNLVNRGIKSRDLRVSMKIPFIDDVGMNYLKAYDDDNILYYFINNIEWLNDGTSLLDLELDTLNTYQTYVLDSKNYKRVNMKRIHKDRFTKINNNYYRKFDTVDEGFQPDIYYTDSTIISPNEQAGYIGYRQVTTSTSASSNLLNYRSQYQKWFIPKVDTKYTVSGYLFLIDGASYWTNTPTRIFCYSPGGLTLYNHKKVGSYDQIEADAMLIEYYPSASGNLVVYNFKLEGDTFTYLSNKTIKSAGDAAEHWSDRNLEIYGRTLWVANIDSDSSSHKLPDLTVNSQYSKDSLALGTDRTIGLSSIQEAKATILGINTINKADSEWKLITETYFTPSTADFVYIGGVKPHFEINPSLEYLALYNQNVTVDNWKKVEIPDNKFITRDKKYETKLYGSYCRNYYLNYDNKTLVLQPERAYSGNSSFTVVTYIPLNMSNNIAFNVSGFKNQTDYDNWLITSRNNNVQIYSDSYLDYIRTGYNYDVKAKEQQSAKNWVSFGLGVASSVAGLGTAFASDKALQSMLVGQGVNTSLGIVSSLTNNILAEQANQDSLNKKKQQAMNATVNISGSDNLVLFNKYNKGANPRINITQPHEHVEQMEFDLFYYFGYADNTTYTTMPNFKNREYFNYCKCDIEYLKPSLTISQNIIKDIQNKFKDGITFEWKYNNTWLCNGTLYENWETSLNLNE